MNQEATVVTRCADRMISVPCSIEHHRKQVIQGMSIPEGEISSVELLVKILWHIYIIWLKC